MNKTYNKYLIITSTLTMTQVHENLKPLYQIENNLITQNHAILEITDLGYIKIPNCACARTTRARTTRAHTTRARTTRARTTRARTTRARTTRARTTAHKELVVTSFNVVLLHDLCTSTGELKRQLCITYCIILVNHEQIGWEN